LSALANIYLHYVFDLWVQVWRQKRAHGDMSVVRFADDIVVGFEFKSDAEMFWKELIERMQTFQLELHPEKTRLLEFGRHAADDPQTTASQAATGEDRIAATYA
jgi:RNA-directed DNA polymerase